MWIRNKDTRGGIGSFLEVCKGVEAMRVSEMEKWM